MFMYIISLNPYLMRSLSSSLSSSSTSSLPFYKCRNWSSDRLTQIAKNRARIWTQVCWNLKFICFQQFSTNWGFKGLCYQTYWGWVKTGKPSLPHSPWSGSMLIMVYMYYVYRPPLPILDCKFQEGGDSCLLTTPSLGPSRVPGTT